MENVLISSNAFKYNNEFQMFSLFGNAVGFFFKYGFFKILPKFR